MHPNFLKRAALILALAVPGAACADTVIGKHVVEGHVPIDSVKRLLKERPAVKGIAVPGMPAGSPGMEAPVKEAFTVFAFTADGKQSAYGAY